MTADALVSVVVPFLNAARFLEEAVESVLTQTYRHWELLLVDDGSTDASTAIARRYAQTHSGRVHYLEHAGHQNRGAASARNLGIRNTRGVYVAFLDADDVWLPEKLEQQVEVMEFHPEAGMLCGATQYWYGWTGRPEDIARDKIVHVGGPQDAVAQPPALSTLMYPLGKNTGPCVSSLLVRKPTIDRIGGFEESFHGIYQLYEDQVFLIKLYLETPVFIASRCHDRYRIHADSCVSTVRQAGQYHVVRRHFLNWLKGYLLDRNIRDRRIWSHLNRALAEYRYPLRLVLPLLYLWRDRMGRLRRLAKAGVRSVLPAPARLRTRWWDRPGRPAPVRWRRTGRRLHD